MRISELLTPALVKIGLESETKDELFQEMVQLFVDAGQIKDREGAIAALLDRESKMSTGIAKGVEFHDPDFLFRRVERGGKAGYNASALLGFVHARYKVRRCFRFEFAGQV